MALSGRFEQSGSTGGSGNVGRIRKCSVLTSGASLAEIPYMPLQNIQVLSACICYIRHCKRLNGFAQNIRTVNEVSLISKTSRREERGVIRHRQYRIYGMDFIEVIVHSLCPINQPVNINADIFKYNKRPLVQIINNAVV